LRKKAQLPFRPRLNGARALEKGLLVLELVADAEGDQSLSVLAAQSGLPLSTVHRLLATLTRRGFVEQDPQTRRYRLGARTLTLAATVLQQADLTREAPPIMQEFVRETGDAVSLAALQDGRVVLLEKAQGPDAPRLFLHIGRQAPVHSTALGKALAAGLPDQDVLEILRRQGMARLTPRTITTPQRFLLHLEAIRRSGYALDDEETVVGARCLAVPVRNHRGQVVGALSTSGPTSTWSEERMAVALHALQRAAARLSERLGYRPPRQGSAQERTPIPGGRPGVG